MAFFDTPARMQKIPTASPQQMAASQQALQTAMAGLKPGSFDFGPIEQQARRGFQQKTLPSIAERFTAMGASPSSGGLYQALSQAGSDLEGNLAAMRQQYGLQQQGLLQNLLQTGLQPQFQYAYQPGQQGFLSSLLAPLGVGLGALIPSLFGRGRSNVLQEQSSDTTELEELLKRLIENQQQQSMSQQSLVGPQQQQMTGIGALNLPMPYSSYMNRL